MDPKLIYVKTPIGDEAIRQSTRVVQRNLRMVLVQVDGKLSIGELATKIGNPRLVEAALKELAKGGFIAPATEAVATWVQSKKPSNTAPISALSQFSTFGKKPANHAAPDDVDEISLASNFSSFGKPILPSSQNRAGQTEKIHPVVEDDQAAEVTVKHRVSLLKWGGASVGGCAIFILGVAGFYPYDNFKPAIETSLSRYFQTPVRVGQVGVTLLPLPQLKLDAVTLGESADSRIAEIRIASPLSLLMGAPYQLSSVRVSGAVLSANRLVALPMFSQPAGAMRRDISIGEIRLTDTQFTAGDVALRDVAGTIRFKPDGSIEKASFEAVDRSIQLTAMPTDQGIALNIEGLGWKPAGSVVAFESLQAKGLLQKDKLLIQSVDTTFLGGILKGSFLLDWRNGLVFTGDGQISRLDCRKVSAAFAPVMKLDGDLGGAFKLRAAGSDWSTMWRNVEASLDAEVTRGVFNGVDLGEAARRGSNAVVRSGSTKFERLRTAIVINPDLVSGRDLQLDAGMMTASGQFSVSKGQLEAGVVVGIQTSVSSLRVPVKISGHLPDISAVSSK